MRKTITLIRGFKLLLWVISATIMLNSCSSVHRTLREPNVRVELERADFELSAQVSAEATMTKVLGIDWKNLRHKETGELDKGLGMVSLASLPVIGDYLQTTAGNYALHHLMRDNPGYDVIFYPQYIVNEKKPILGIGIFKTVTTVKVTARLGKIK